MSTPPWPLPSRGHDPDPRPPRGSWLFKLATVLLLALLAVPFLPESVRVILPEGWRLRLPRVEFVKPETAHEQVQLAAADSVTVKEPERLEPPVVAPDLSLDAVAVEPHEDSVVAKPAAVLPPPRPRHVARHVVQPRSEEADEPENVTYQPEYAVSMIPTRIQTEVRLSSPPASAVADSERAARAVQTDDNATRQDAATAGVADDDKDWPLLCGQVVDASGNPVEGAHVELESPRLTVSTDTKGRFCVACPTGDRTVRIDAASRGRATRIVTLKSSVFEMRIELSQQP